MFQALDSDSNPADRNRTSDEQKDEMAPKQKGHVRPKVNVSHLRRENELYRVIEGFGGMANLQTKEFSDAHMRLVEVLYQAGEPTSTPVGTRLDKRTAEATLSGMVARGRIKMLKTSLVTSLGVARPATIVYMSDVEQEKLNKFLADLGRNYSTQATYVPSVKTIEEPLKYGTAPNQTQRPPLPLQLLQMEDPGDDSKERWKQNSARAEQLFTFDDATIREVLLSERTTVGQLYGLIVGKVMRVRELHLTTLDFFESQIPSPRIISHEHRIVELSFFYHDLHLSSFCALIGSLGHSEELEQFLQTPEGKQTPVDQIPQSLHSFLQVGRARTRTRFFDLLEILRCLGLVTPLRIATSDEPAYICRTNGDHPTAFDITSLEGWSTTSSVNAPIYWTFNERASIYLWSQSETSPPFWQDVTIKTSSDAIHYWRLLDEACRNRDIAIQAPGASTGSVIGPSNASTSVARTLRRDVSWHASYRLTWHQEQYLRKFVDSVTGDTPLQDEGESQSQLQRISWVISAPQAATEKYFGRARRKIKKQMDKVREKRKQVTSEEEAKNAVEAKALLRRKAAEAKWQKEKDWDDMLLRVHPDPLKGSAAVRMRRTRSHFLQSSTGRDMQKWEEEISQAIREVKLKTKEVTINHKSQLFATPTSMHVAPPPVVSNISEKSVGALVSQQGPPILQKERKRKGKDKPTGDNGEFLYLAHYISAQANPYRRNT